ncbi:HAAS signaling domain-containing protein [Phenylobacterium sp.]|uniref:DUF1700 domain-containing protein n=1 Tax=Phenylobacterium sp. TaxID=1871053 RepID=UPI00286E8559|nr:DUF1700 domain-containing protein [Phenylobacterium sp.]
MTREAFLARLREGLRSLPPQAMADIVADYETHFADGVAAGRSEAEVAQALGDPDRLARELQAEKSLSRWRDDRSPSSAAAAVFAVLGLGAIDILILLPILMTVGATLFGLFMAVIAVFFAGGVVFAAGPFLDPPGGVAAALLAGIGLMAGSASGGALLSLASIGLVNALVWYGRLHYRLLKPAL